MANEQLAPEQLAVTARPHVWQLVIHDSRTGEALRSITYHSVGHAKRGGKLAMTWLPEDRFHTSIVPPKARA